MKIFFLCGSLEPGRDGVGDYTRRLSGELIRQGHEIAAAALHDVHITEVYAGKQETEGIYLSVLRMPAVLPAKKRFRQVHEWINEIEPEWISLQFVPFSFHPKGVPVTLGNYLTKLGKDRRWHIMFHELWVGMDEEAPDKLVWWGWLQCLLIRNLILRLRPGIMHTQTHIYQAQLMKLGYAVGYLPLFANIPAFSQTCIGPYEEQIPEITPSAVSFVIFGTIHPGAPVEQLASEAASYREKHRTEVFLIMIGRCGTEKDHWAAAWRAAGLRVEMLGEQPPERISEVLGKATMGVSTTPIALIEKSGSVAVMHAHNLPVLCVSKSWRPRGKIKLKLPLGVAAYRTGNLENCLASKKRFLSRSTLSQVSCQLANDLLQNDAMQ